MKTALRVILFLFGIVLLLPGLCSAVFLVIAGGDLSDPGFAQINLAGFAIGAAGVGLLWYVIKKL